MCNCEFFGNDFQNIFLLTKELFHQFHESMNHVNHIQRPIFKLGKQTVCRVFQT